MRLRAQRKERTMNKIIRAIKRTYARKTGRVVNIGKHGVLYARQGD